MEKVTKLRVLLFFFVLFQNNSDVDAFVILHQQPGRRRQDIQLLEYLCILCQKCKIWDMSCSTMGTDMRRRSYVQKLVSNPTYTAIIYWMKQTACEINRTQMNNRSSADLLSTLSMQISTAQWENEWNIQVNNVRYFSATCPNSVSPTFNPVSSAGNQHPLTVLLAWIKSNHSLTTDHESITCLLHDWKIVWVANIFRFMSVIQDSSFYFPHKPRRLLKFSLRLVFIELIFILSSD